VGSNHIATATAEFANISAWAAKNNLRLNQLKTRELVITRRRHKSNIKPEGPVVHGAEQVSTLRVLGVVLQSNLSMGAHIDHILARCASSTHALRILRSHGLGSHKLHEVARMTSLAMLLYASSSWWGFTSAQDRQRLESMVRRMIRWGFLADDAPTFESLVSAADQRLKQLPLTNAMCYTDTSRI